MHVLFKSPIHLLHKHMVMSEISFGTLFYSSLSSTLDKGQDSTIPIKSSTMDKFGDPTSQTLGQMNAQCHLAVGCCNVAVGR